MEQIKMQEQPKAILLEVVQKGRPGRKRKLTPALFEKIMCSVQSGDRINASCVRYGISDSTLFAQIARDPDCAKRFAKAKAIRLQHWHEEWIGEMCDHSKHSPWATGFLLERNFPQLYALRSVNRDNPEDKPAEIDTPAEVLARHRALMLELAREDEKKQAQKALCE
jgi:hypothetical protein